MEASRINTAVGQRLGPLAAPAWLAVLAVGAVLAYMYAEIFRGLVDQWRSDANYSHGFLVPFFSAFVLWQRRRELAVLEWRGTWIGLPIVIGGVAMLLAGQIGVESFLSRTSFIVILAGLVLFHCGVRVFRAVLFPLAFLLFMVPLHQSVFYAIAFPLQGIAARNAAWTLEAIGVPVLLDGNVIHLSHITLGVTEACSGIRSLISMTALAVAWAYLTLPAWGIVVLAAAAVPITVIANAGRVVSTGLIGQWFGVYYAQGLFHAFSGWVIFVFAFVCLIGAHGVITLLRKLWARYQS